MPRIVAGEALERATTVASAIRIAAPVHRAEAEAAIEAADGAVVPLTDDELLAVWRELAEREGVFCEPASAAGVAALAKVELEPGARVVCVITGHGLKDPAAVDRVTVPPLLVDPDPDAIAAAAA